MLNGVDSFSENRIGVFDVESELGAYSVVAKGGFIGDLDTAKPLRRGNLEHTESAIPFLKKGNDEIFEVCNPTAVLWEKCDGTKTVQDIAKEMHRALGAPKKFNELKPEIIRSIKQLRDAGFVYLWGGGNGRA